MKFTADDVRHVAGLARLRIDDAGADRFADELTRIVAWVDQLGDVAEEVPEVSAELRRRPDEPRATEPGPLLAESAGADDGFVAVPPVMEGR